MVCRARPVGPAAGSRAGAALRAPTAGKCIVKVDALPGLALHADEAVALPHDAVDRREPEAGALPDVPSS